MRNPALPTRRITGDTVTIEDVRTFAFGIVGRFEESKPEERTDESFLLYMLASHFLGMVGRVE